MRRKLAVFCVATLVLVSTVSPVAASHQPSFVVAVQSDGDATVTVTSTYNLDSDSEQAAFEELRTNDTARSLIEQRFQDRLATVAANTENQTGRAMSIESTSVELTTESSTGVVELTAEWRGLAATIEQGFALTEPFASNFEPDRQFVVVLPDGYEATSVTPGADSSDDGRYVWSAGTSLDGFELVAQSPSTAGDSTEEQSADDGATDDGATDDGGENDAEAGTTTSSGPGFGVGASVVVLLSLLLLSRRS